MFEATTKPIAVRTCCAAIANTSLCERRLDYPHLIATRGFSYRNWLKCRSSCHLVGM